MCAPRCQEGPCAGLSDLRIPTGSAAERSLRTVSETLAIPPITVNRSVRRAPREAGAHGKATFRRTTHALAKRTRPGVCGRTLCSTGVPAPATHSLAGTPRGQVPVSRILFPRKAALCTHSSQCLLLVVNGRYTHRQSASALDVSLTPVALRATARAAFIFDIIVPVRFGLALSRIPDKGRASEGEAIIRGPSPSERHNRKPRH